MKTFKKGQRVWWDDPVCEKSGEYYVLDPKDNIDKPTDECMILIGKKNEKIEVRAEYLQIVSPISDEDRQQLEQQECENRRRDMELLVRIQELVAQFEDQCFSVDGYSVKIADEEHEPCCVSEFRVEGGILLAELDYDDGRCRTALAADLGALELFRAFNLLVKNTRIR